MVEANPGTLRSLSQPMLRAALCLVTGSNLSLAVTQVRHCRCFHGIAILFINLRYFGVDVSFILDLKET